MSKRRELLNKSDYIKRSGTFLLPMLQTPIYHINDKTNYLIDVGFVQMGFPQIVVIFDNVDYIPLKEDVYRLSNISCYVDSEFGDEDREMCMFFDIPKEFKKDFELFTQGLYSQFSEKYKELLIKKYGKNRERGLTLKTLLPNVGVYDSIYPLDDMKKLMAKCLSTNNHNVDWKEIKEVLDPPNIELEEFKSIEELC